MKTVKVKEVPVRYEGTTYLPEETFEMASEHVNEKLVVVTGEVDNFEQSSENEIDPYANMTVPELKAYAEEQGITLKVASKRDDIIEAITEHDLSEN